MPLHTNDFGNLSTGMLGGQQMEDGNMMYHGMDIGAYVDFAAINKIIQEALKKIPPGMMPPGGEEMSATVVVHGAGMGSAWIMSPNPYKTWRW